MVELRGTSIGSGYTGPKATQLNRQMIVVVCLFRPARMFPLTLVECFAEPANELRTIIIQIKTRKVGLDCLALDVLGLSNIFR